MGAGRVLFIKLDPYDSLVSSNMRMLALMKGIDQLGYSMDLLTVGKSAALVDNDMSDYGFLKDVNILYAGRNTAYEVAVSNKKRGLFRVIYPIIRSAYHAFSLYDHTVKIAKSILLISS